jgi:hypothetical protein
MRAISAAFSRAMIDVDAGLESYSVYGTSRLD